jgi:sugar/nucleoside kinase (ribokinase family)
MATILVVGHVNHDRLWRLDGVLAPGARLGFSEREVRLGGGGFFTGDVLLELGHEVVLVTNLADDELGHAALATLVERGFDTSQVTFVPGATEFAEIFVDPSGERTIVGNLGRSRPPLALVRPVAADAAYINTTRAAPELIATTSAVPFVASQYPLRGVSHRPADILIGSRADMAIEDRLALWVHACDLAGPRLSSLIVTDGGGPVTLVDGHGATEVSPETLGHLSDTTGAGDFFAGGYVHATLAGLTPEAAVRHANAVAAKRLQARLVPFANNPA